MPRQARSLFRYWATSELGVDMTQLAAMPNISQPSVSICARRGGRIAVDGGHKALER